MATDPCKLPLFRTCDQESCEPIQAKVKGRLPVWLTGSLVRNGPGLRRLGDTEYKHLFDGLALLHMFTIDGPKGTVTYQNRFLRSDAYKQNTTANRIVVSDFGTRAFPDPCKTLFQRFMAYFTFKEFSDNASVNFFKVANRIYATTETPFIHRISEKTLETYEKVDMSQVLTLNTMTAHPHVDDGNLYNIGTFFGLKSYYKVVNIPSSSDIKKAKIIASIPVSRPLNPSYYHSFCLTENYIIFIEQPLVLSITSMAIQHFSGGNYSSALKWKPNYKTYFHVVDRKTGKVIEQIYKSAPFVFFHTINAYEEENNIIVDLCAYSNGNIFMSLYAKNFTEQWVRENGNILYSEARRYVLPVIDIEKESKRKNLITLNYSKAKAFKMDNCSIFCIHERLTKTGINMGEMPRINYKFNGKMYQYFYGINRRDPDLHTKLIKVCIKTKEILYWSQEGYYPSEPVFISRPKSVIEDDGIILSSLISEEDENNGFLLILDANTFKEISRAEYETKGSLTADFHGIYLTAGDNEGNGNYQ